MHITLTVLFSGTGHKKDDEYSLVSALQKQIQTSDTQRVMSFDGCGVTYGLMGVIFGTGLDKQCQEVITEVESLIKAGHTITLNAYGHSRGGIAAMMLAKQLGKISPNTLAINLALMDPVPGNAITTSTLDIANISLANKTIDLTNCLNLQNVMTLYPAEPLPSMFCHAPSFLRYPKNTNVEECVVPGCHSSAQIVTLQENGVSFTAGPAVSFIKIFQFLTRSGTLFNPFNLKGWFPPNEIVCQSTNIEAQLTLLKTAYAANLRELRHDKAVFRDTHSADGRYITLSPKKHYFNPEHQALNGANQNLDEVAAIIQKKYGPISVAKRLMLNHPHMIMALKWSGIALGLSAAMIAATTAGLLISGFPLTLPILLIATTGILTASLISTAATMGLWYKAAKPAGKWAINRFFYPHYKERDIHSPSINYCENI